MAAPNPKRFFLSIQFTSSKRKKFLSLNLCAAGKVKKRVLLGYRVAACFPVQVHGPTACAVITLEFARDSGLLNGLQCRICEYFYFYILIYYGLSIRSFLEKNDFDQELFLLYILHSESFFPASKWL